MQTTPYPMIVCLGVRAPPASVYRGDGAKVPLGIGAPLEHHLTKWACFSFTHRLSLSCVAHHHYWCWQAGWLIGI